VDRAVEAAVLDAIQPAGVTAAVEALEQVVAEHDTTRQALPLALEKARDEAQRAWRQVLASLPLIAGWRVNSHTAGMRRWHR